MQPQPQQTRRSSAAFAVFLLFLVIWFQWSPPLVFVPLWEDPWENIKQLIWPIVTVGYRNAAVSTRLQRAPAPEAGG